MTDLAQQARRQFVAVADNAHAFAPDEAVVSIEDAVKVALAFRAAQPVEGDACINCGVERSEASEADSCDMAHAGGPHNFATLAAHPDPDASLPGHNPLREALIMAAHLAPGVTRTGSEAERIADAALPLFEGEELVRPDREAVAAKAVAGALFEHISGKYGVRWEGVDLPEEYQFRGKAMGRLAGLRADAILALLPAEPVQEMREGEREAMQVAFHAIDAVLGTSDDVIEWIEPIRASKRGQADDDETRRERKSALYGMLDDAREKLRAALAEPEERGEGK